MNSCIVSKTNRQITINVTPYDGAASRHLRVTIDDVAKYYAHEARNLTSGCRTIAGFSGDWRGIDRLAQFCLDHFKAVSRLAMIAAVEPYGMRPNGW